MKVTAGIFRKNNSVLLMRRAPTEPLAGEWEYPGGKFEDGEDGPICLHRELKEELGIDANIGKLITVSKLQLNSGKELELYAYEVLDYSGDIKLKVHDQQEWVEFTNLLQQTTKKIWEFIFKEYKDKTIIAISHTPELLNHVNKVIEFNNGCGTVKEK